MVCLKIAFLFCCNLNFAQEGLEFKPSKQFYFRGKSAITGNNILSVDPKKSFNDSSEINDTYSLTYVDIDNDTSTFSSSSADLLIEKDAKIAYAALYWSATYPFEIGKKAKSNNEIIYHGNDFRDPKVNAVLLKTPTAVNYIPITGEIIFDGHNNNSFKTNSPYVCYADITNLLKASNQWNGTFTVANIKGSQGYISGGSSGGWLLYVIYELDKATPKYFTTYNGFIGIEDKPVAIKFKDFKTPSTGQIKTSLAIAALEGDSRIKSDFCSIIQPESKNFIDLKTEERNSNNFFNSSITIENQTENSRYPNSKNTLGFDLLTINISNENNAFLKPNSTETILQFSTSVDRFYPFFIAFETDISYEFYESKFNIIASVKSIENENVAITNPEPKNLETPNNTIISSKITVSKYQDKVNALKSISIPSLKKGFYLVTNVFKNEFNTKKWIAFLNENGYTPNFYINPENNWYYVYIKSNSNPDPIFLEKERLSNVDYFKGLWVAKINY